MPLPLALQARLEKRGIIKKQSSAPEEEIIAEDYDEQPFVPKVIPRPVVPKEPVPPSEPELMVSGCPNKWNPYHDCTEFCIKHWGDGIKTPDPDIDKLRIRMLKKYPLPPGWEEIYDPGTGRHYYWNPDTDEVCWLSPKHPRAEITLPASKLRDVLNNLHSENSKHSSDEEYAPGEEPEREDYKRRKHSSRYSREKTSSRSSRSRREELDPMDPSSYSECPRGTWSSGLERKGEAKTGVDTTASGPLYQMRPYPSPGAVLRANAEHKSKK